MGALPLRVVLAVSLAAGSIAPTPALASVVQDVAPTLPDSALSGLSGRQVVLTTTAGLSVEGELAAFDASSITIVRTDGQVVVVSRNEVAKLAVSGTSPTPESSPPAPAPPRTVSPSPSPTAGVSPPAAERTLTEAERQQLALVLLQNGLPPECVPDSSTPACRSTLTQGADHLEKHGISATATGGVMLGLGLGVAAPLGLWLVFTADQLKDAEKACEAAGTSCGKRSTGRYVGGFVSIGLFGILSIGGVLIMSAGGKQRGAARRLREQHNLSLAPLIGPAVGGASFSGRF